MSFRRKLLPISLRPKIMFSMLVVSLIPTIIVGTLSIHNISLFSMREMERTSLANLTSACEALKRELTGARVEAIRPSVYESEVTYDILRAENEHRKIDMAQAFQLQVLLTQVSGISQIHSIYVFGLHGGVYTNQPAPSLAYELLAEQPWFARWRERNDHACWGEPMGLGRSTVLPYARKIMDGEELLGISVVNVYESALYEVCKPYGKILVLNKNNVVLSAEQKSMVGRDFFEAIGGEGDTKVSGSGLFSLDYEGTAYSAVYYDDSIYDLRMIELLSSEKRRPAMQDMLYSTTMIVLICAVFCVALSYFFSSAITRPLHKIRGKVDELQLETLEPNMRPNSSDEIGLLIGSINNMALRLAASKAEIYRASEELRRAEYRAVELQINSHFLYNTLSSINYLTDRNEPEKVKQVVESLSTLFRISVNSGRGQLRIQDEIRHVRCYLEILSIRHESEFSYQMDIAPEILDYFTIKILLQPLVENAIQHGVREHSIKDGFIRIAAYQQGDRVIFEVMDNGAASEEKICELNHVIAHAEEYPGYGIGMLNVHNRIVYYYNHDFGLTYMKRNGMTVAHIEIPVCKGEDDVQFPGGGG